MSKWWKLLTLATILLVHFCRQWLGILWEPARALRFITLKGRQLVFWQMAQHTAHKQPLTVSVLTLPLQLRSRAIVHQRNANATHWAGSSDGTSQGKPKRIHDVTLRLHETVGGSRHWWNNADRIFFRDSSMPMNAAVPLFTGDKISNSQVVLRKVTAFAPDTATPITILALYPRMNTHDL